MLGAAGRVLAGRDSGPGFRVVYADVMRSCALQPLLLLCLARASCFSCGFSNGRIFGIGSVLRQTLLSCFVPSDCESKSDSKHPAVDNWIISDPENATAKNGIDFNLVIASYNILADCYAQKYTRDPAISRWSIRKVALLAEICKLDADIICLQEVDVDSSSFFLILLQIFCCAGNTANSKMAGTMDNGGNF